MKQGKKHKINKFSTSFSTTNKRKIVKKTVFYEEEKDNEEKCGN